MVGRGMSGIDLRISLARESIEVDFRGIDLASVVVSQTTEAPALSSLVEKQLDVTVQSRWISLSSWGRQLYS